jgi:hypothetical protein
MRESLGEHFDLKNWPHRFTKEGNSFQIGEDPQTHDGIFAQSMICIDCNIKFVSGQQNRPADPCPARTEKTEKKRLFS